MTLDALNLLKQIPGHKIMIRGNHDDKLSLNQFQTVFKEIHGLIKYKRMWLCHGPLHPQEVYLHKGMLGVVHGHIHANSLSPPLPLPYFNVNWDFIKTPVSLDEVRITLTEFRDTPEFHEWEGS